MKSKTSDMAKVWIIRLVMIFLGAMNDGAVLAQQQPAPQMPATTPFCSLEELACLPWPQLECLYRQAAPGAIPAGAVRGQSFLPPGRCLRGLRSRIMNCVWRGKQFCPANGSVVNQWRVGQAIRGEVYYGRSWLDGKPSIIIDYRRTSRIWGDARDEFREVAPGLYVGIMYLERCPQPWIKTYFILQCASSP